MAALPVMEGREAPPVFLFHIPKTGGASIVAAAKTALGAGGVRGIFDAVIEPGPSLPLSARTAELLKDRNVGFFHGHVSPANLPEALPMRRVVILRDPVERLISHFCYCYDYRHNDARQFDYFLKIRAVRRTSFGKDDIANWARQFNVDNYMTRYLTGEMSLPLKEWHAGRACELLEGMRYIGFTETLNSVFSDLGTAVMGRPFTPIRINASNRNLTELSEQDIRELSEDFVSIDCGVFEEARRLASALSQGEPFGRRYATAQAPARIFLRRLRYRTLREILLALGIRTVPHFRRWLERFIASRSTGPFVM